MVGPDGKLPLPWLGDWLASALQHQRGHAVLLHGPQGIGQWELALTLGQAWLCETRSATRPCGQCASCRLVQAHSHPDLLVLLPEALQQTLGWASGGDDDVAEEKGSKTRQPSKDIKVDAVRAAVAFAQTTPSRGVAKVIVVHPAERMNGIAANALLKTLEEPAGVARFVLGSAAPDALLPTIRSRCQAMALGIPDPKVAVPWLAAQGIADTDVVLAAAGGQPLDARDWAGEGLDASQWARLPELVARGEVGVLAGWPVPRVVGALQKLCHDALSVAVGAPPRYFPVDSVRGSARPAALIAWARELTRAARHVDHPLNAGLLVESLAAQGQRALGNAPDATPSRRSVRYTSAHE